MGPKLAGGLARHAIHPSVVLAEVAEIGNEAADVPDFDLKRLW